MKIHTCLIAAALSSMLSVQFCTAKDDASKKSDAVKLVKKDTPESLTDELLVAFEKLPVAVSKVTDKATAEIAAREIEKIGDEIDSIAKRLDPLPEPSDEVKLRIDEKMKKGSEGLSAKLAASIKKLSDNPEALNIVGAAFQKFGIRMNKHDKTFEKFGKDKKDASKPDQGGGNAGDDAAKE